LRARAVVGEDATASRRVGRTAMEDAAQQPALTDRPRLRPSSTARRRRRERDPNRRLLTAPLLAGPAVVLYVGLVFLPLVLAIVYSLTNKNLLFPHTHYVGGHNYRELWHDDTFRRSLRTTAILSALIVAVPNALGLGVALLLRGEGRFYAILRVVFFVPQVLSAVVVSFIWQTMLTDDGTLNTILQRSGLGFLKQPWLDDPNHAIAAIAIVVSWQFVGFCAVVYLAALKTIPNELLEAAEVDGCTGWRRFRRVTWPLVAPAFTVSTVFLFVIAFKLFDYVKVITNGGPGDATNTIALNIYNVGFAQNAFGYASAMAVVLFVIVASVSAVAVILLRRREVNL
jgi:multiple sugar transport system permease protein